MPPLGDKVKLNVDGSFSSTSACMGTGGLIRTSVGGWVVGFSTHEGEGDSLLAELLAVKNGINLAWDEGFRDIYCETDSMETLELLQTTTDYGLHRFALVIHDIRSMLDREWTVFLLHAFREANCCADHLAGYGLHQRVAQKVWREPPGCMGSLLLKDNLHLIRVE